MLLHRHATTISRQRAHLVWVSPSRWPVCPYIKHQSPLRCFRVVVPKTGQWPRSCPVAWRDHGVFRCKVQDDRTLWQIRWRGEVDSPLCPGSRRRACVENWWRSAMTVEVLCWRSSGRHGNRQDPVPGIERLRSWRWIWNRFTRDELLLLGLVLIFQEYSN